jgi:hypothetical protein
MVVLAQQTRTVSKETNGEGIFFVELVLDEKV